MEAKYKRAEQENSQLRREVEELRLDFVAQKKEMKKLQAGFVAQKNKLEIRFAAQKKELEAEYQKQVDEMYFFSCCCYMKKNGIINDIPSLSSNDEDEIPRGPSR